MSLSQDNEFARNTHILTVWYKNRVFLKTQSFKKETFPPIETFTVF